MHRNSPLTTISNNLTNIHIFCITNLISNYNRQLILFGLIDINMNSFLSLAELTSSVYQVFTVFYTTKPITTMADEL